MKTLDTASKPAILPGDVFRKSGKFESLWVVLRDVRLSGDFPPHVHLANINAPDRPLTFANAALVDRKLFERVA